MLTGVAQISSSVVIFFENILYKSASESVIPIFVTKWLPMGARRDVFQAIADPTRREIINRLAAQSLNLNAVAENFDISRPAISKHIKILTECGLINIRREGRERYCDAQLHKLKEVAAWIEKYSQFWDKKLNALQQFLAKEKKQPAKK